MQGVRGNRGRLKEKRRQKVIRRRGAKTETYNRLRFSREMGRETGRRGEKGRDRVTRGGSSAETEREGLLAARGWRAGGCSKRGESAGKMKKTGNQYRTKRAQGKEN